MNKDIEDKLAEIFSIVFELETDSNPIDINRDSTEKWDSLSHVTLVTAIENEFDIFMDIADTQQMISFQETKKLIDKLLKP